MSRLDLHLRKATDSTVKSVKDGSKKEELVGIESDNHCINIGQRMLGY